MGKIIMLVAMVLVLVVSQVQAYTLDLGTTSADMVTIGGVILLALGGVAGFALVVRMVRKAG